MANKINIAELLKDCPGGMELDCTICDNVYFDKVTSNMIRCFIKNDDGTYRDIYFPYDGTYLSAQNAKCVIFPKGKTTWEGFHRPFKDGDVITCTNHSCTFVAIYKHVSGEDAFYRYACLVLDGGIHFSPNYTWSDFANPRFATEEEKEQLFKAIKDNGYRWNAETKTLEKLIKPKFKVGDRIKYKNGKNIDGVEQGIILSITDDTYDVAVTNNMGIFVPIADQEKYELVPNKFDINTLKPFDKVLVRTKNYRDTWICAFFSYKTDYEYSPYWTTADKCYQQCIPYEGNEYLLGTTNNCDEFYKTWE